MSNENAESPVSPNDSAFFLRVKFKCKTAENVESIISCLKQFVDFQLEHPFPGVLLYNFSHPDPQGQPLLLQFFELYTNAEVFFEHSKDDNLAKVYAETFFPPEKIQEWSKVYTYGCPATNNQAVKAVCDFLKSSYPDTVTGYLLADNPAKILAAGHTDAVFMVSEITVKAGDCEAVINHLKSITSSNENKALMFHVGNNEKHEEANTYEITAIYVNNTDMVKHLKDVKESFQTIKKLASAFHCQMLGDVSSSSKSEIENFGFPVCYTKADTGYVLHPLAEQAFQC